MTSQRLHILTWIKELPNSKPRYLSHDVAQGEDRHHETGQENVSLPGMLHCTAR